MFLKDTLSTTYSILWCEETLLLPPAVPLGLHVARTVGIWEGATQVLLLSGSSFGGVHRSLLDFLGALLKDEVEKQSVALTFTNDNGSNYFHSLYHITSF